MISHPCRWHIYVVGLNPRVGTKPGKQGPCISIQPSEFAEGGLQSTVIVPLTTKITHANAFPLRVRIPKGTCGLTSDSDAMIEQMLSWDNDLFHKDLGILPDEIQEEIKRALADFLDLD